MKALPEWLKTGLILLVAFAGDVIAAIVGSKIAHAHPDPKVATAKGLGQAVGEALRKQTEYDRHELQEKALPWLEAKIGGPSTIKQLLTELNQRGPFEIGGKFYTEDKLSHWLADILRIGGSRKGRNELLRLESICAASREAFVAEYEIVHHDGVLQTLKLMWRIGSKKLHQVNRDWHIGVACAEHNIGVRYRRRKAAAMAAVPNETAIRVLTFPRVVAGALLLLTIFLVAIGIFIATSH